MENQYMQPFFDSLSQGVQVAQHLRQAALQQQQLDQERQAQQARQALAEQEFNAQQQQSLAQALQNGAQPVDASGKISAPNYAAGTPQRVATHTAPDGLPQGTGGTLMPTLAQSGTAQVTPNDGSTYQIAGQTLAAPTLSDQLNRAAAIKQATADATRVPITKEGAAMIGNIFPEGTLVDPAHMPGLASLARAKQAQDAGKDASKVIQATHESVDDKGNRTETIVYTDGSVEEKPLKAKGKSDKFDPANAAANATNAQTKAMTDNQREERSRSALKDYQDRIKEEQALDTEANNLTIALRTGKHYVDKDGNLSSFSAKANPIPEEEQPAFQDAMRSRLQAIQQRLPQVISDKQGAMNRYADLSKNEGARPKTTVTAASASSPQGALAPKTTGARAATKKYNPGDVVKRGGVSYKVLGYNADGTIKAQPI